MYCREYKNLKIRFLIYIDNVKNVNSCSNWYVLCSIFSEKYMKQLCRYLLIYSYLCLLVNMCG